MAMTGYQAVSNVNTYKPVDPVHFCFQSVGGLGKREGETMLR